MPTPGFDVNDAGLREWFLRHEVPQAMDRLRHGSLARWGKMQAQEMVEHLAWAFDLSTGFAHTACATPASELQRLRQFLYSNRPSPREFMNPALLAGLPALRHATLGEAKAACRQALGRFLDRPQSDQELHTHPVFGLIGREEWHRTHYKHTHHHLLQFGLIEPE
jgi:oxepin-CoA hydrolase/3-oxo-5,6-dehydrosuberyl-CoA semialdehyde dehydrogenase